MALTQAVWSCPCCGAELWVVAQAEPPAAAAAKPRRRRKQQKSPAELRAMRGGAREVQEWQRAEDERLGSLAGAAAKDDEKGVA